MHKTLRDILTTNQERTRPLFTDEERERIAEALRKLKAGKLFGPDGQRYRKEEER